MYIAWVASEPEKLGSGTLAAPVDWPRVMLFFAGLTLLVLIPAIVARWIDGKDSLDPWRLWQRFNRLIAVCRIGIVVWFAVHLFYWHAWPAAVMKALGLLPAWPMALPGMILGPLPALLAWVGIWWAQYPIDRLTRDESVLPRLDAGLPVHAPPTLASLIAGTLRLQVLATVIPLWLIALVHDAAAVSIWLAGGKDVRETGYETIVSLGAALLVLTIAPEPLRRILRTVRLPASTLRDRLDRLCRLARTRYREVLLWRTNYAMGNAAVMGILPQVRYVMLSDLLLETMSDREIEAVFAHELGHIVHRHTLWYVVFLGVIVFLAAGVAFVAEQVGVGFGWSQDILTIVGHGTGVVTVVGAVLLFGAFSRCLERQADVYAARAMQHLSQFGETGDCRRTPVGHDGADALAGALHQAAHINHIPVSARSFRHGSIARRVEFVRRLAAEPTLTFKFDRSMRVLYWTLIVLLAAGAGLLAPQIL